MSRARELSPAVAALLGVGAGAGAVTVAGRLLLQRQAAAARQVIGKPLGEEALVADRTYGKSLGHPVDLLLLGDSIAAGLGAETPRKTLGGQLAKRVSKRTGRAVRLHTAARVGAETSMLAGQIATLPPTYRPEVAVVVVGGNDVTHRVRLAESRAHLAQAITALQERGAAVVVGTCPDLAALHAVPQPLRTLAGLLSRQLAAAQRQVAADLGAHAVSLATVVGPFFVTQPDQMFSQDRFHPSGVGYRRTAKALLPSVLAALGEVDEVPFGHHPPTVG
ncbi:SGNH/GDSL hydrolase family protein [Nocardioides daphniae]|uniref:Lipase n=1 Tax=Nocardioides daphniae TaxID=402297 RepID=A0ABQ1QLF1_9ACTN|nr:SGNH/GDSL hydrolase family protein [Nocardioides daphniae]GGD30016.1 lipase [Nocardioides daphniae]